MHASKLLILSLLLVGCSTPITLYDLEKAKELCNPWDIYSLDTYTILVKEYIVICTDGRKFYTEDMKK